MKVQYFGDINDYRKFALLRLLSEVGGFKFGVCWMRTEADGSTQGAKREHLRDPAKWPRYDPELFDALSGVSAQPTLEDLQRVERDRLIPGTVYFEGLVPGALEGRKRFHRDSIAALAGTELVFFDPDNGLEIRSCPKGRKGSSKYLFLNDLDDHYRSGRSALIYQQFPRSKRPAFVTKVVNQLIKELPGASIWSLTTAHVVFLLAAKLKHTARVAVVAETINKKGWTPEFGRATYGTHRLI